MKQVVIMMFFVFGLSFTHAQEFTKKRKQIKKIVFIKKGIKEVYIINTEDTKGKEFKGAEEIANIPTTCRYYCYPSVFEETGVMFIGIKTVFELLHFSESRVYIQN